MITLKQIRLALKTVARVAPEEQEAVAFFRAGIDRLEHEWNERRPATHEPIAVNFAASVKPLEVLK